MKNLRDKFSAIYRLFKGPFTRLHIEGQDNRSPNRTEHAQGPVEIPDFIQVRIKRCRCCRRIRAQDPNAARCGCRYLVIGNQYPRPLGRQHPHRGFWGHLPGTSRQSVTAN